MASVTQRIPNFLGGVSQQTDDLKFPGQLTRLDNGYPDPTFGLIKRPGGQFVKELKDGSNNLIAPNAFNDGKWFSIFRDNNERYAVVIKGTTINVWSLLDGTPRTVTYGTGATDYLTGGKDDYDILTINDYTFITNKTKVVTTQAAPSYTARQRGTVVLKDVTYGAVYSVKVDGTEKTYTTFNAEDTITSPSQTKNKVNADAILDSLTSSLNTISGVTATRIGTTIEIEKTAAFTLDVKGGPDGDALIGFQDSVDNISKLPSKAKHGRVVQITNSTQNQDDYFVRFVANDGVSGAGYWEETIKPDVSPGLVASSMPHQLVRNADGTFTFQQVTWEPRLVGDDETNAHPSFVGTTIQQLFFYNNRLGFLSDENVCLSQAGDYFNLYHTSALTSIASDPVDISCSSIRPATLHGVVPVAQGLLLFSRSQQFLMQGAQGILTPGGTTIKTVSNYEMDPLNDPVDLGTTVAFISKTPAYSRVFEMMTRGQDDSPVVTDISRIVPEWIPSTIDQVVSSPQNSLLSLGSTTSRELYLFRFYASGETRELQSWFRWVASGNVIHHAIDRDIVWMITQQQSSLAIQKLSIIQSPTSSTFLTADGSRVDPRLDMWATPTSSSYDSTVGDEHTKIYLPFTPDPNRTLCVVTANPNQTTPSYSNSGLVVFPSVLQDGTGYYARVDRRDLTSDDLIVGYTYDFNIEMPRLFYRSGNDSQTSDWSASLTIARILFRVGLGGEVSFRLKARGRNEWENVDSVQDADYYLSNDIPFTKTNQYAIPIHQKSDNFTLSVFSNSPFPLSLVSATWEGRYSPRYYRRT